MTFDEKQTFVKVRVESWCPSGQVLVANLGVLTIGYNPAPIFEAEGQFKLLVVHDEAEAFRVKETIREYDDLVLMEDDDPA